MDIRHLFITSTNLAVLEKSSLRALAQKLDILDLPQNLLNAVPSEALKPLSHTRTLNIPHNNISYIGDRSFEGMEQLHRLSLYGNHISRIEPNAFKGIER